jgi:hypothetical protein
VLFLLLKMSWVRVMSAAVPPVDARWRTGKTGSSPARTHFIRLQQKRVCRKGTDGGLASMAVGG